MVTDDTKISIDDDVDHLVFVYDLVKDVPLSDVDNIFLATPRDKLVQSVEQTLVEYLEDNPGKKAMVVCGRKDVVAELAMSDIGSVPILRVTGDCTADEKMSVIREFKSNPDCAVIVGTQLVSEGIDIKEIDLVILAHHVPSIASYVQIGGRLRGVGKVVSFYDPSYMLLNEGVPQLDPCGDVMAQIREFYFGGQTDTPEFNEDLDSGFDSILQFFGMESESVLNFPKDDKDINQTIGNVSEIPQDEIMAEAPMMASALPQTASENSTVTVTSSMPPPKRIPPTNRAPLIAHRTSRNISTTFFRSSTEGMSNSEILESTEHENTTDDGESIGNESPNSIIFDEIQVATPLSSTTTPMRKWLREHNSTPGDTNTLSEHSEQPYNKRGRPSPQGLDASLIRSVVGSAKSVFHLVLGQSNVPLTRLLYDTVDDSAVRYPWKPTSPMCSRCFAPRNMKCVCTSQTGVTVVMLAREFYLFLESILNDGEMRQVAETSREEGPVSILLKVHNKRSKYGSLYQEMHSGMLTWLKTAEQPVTLDGGYKWDMKVREDYNEMWDTLRDCKVNILSYFTTRDNSFEDNVSWTCSHRGDDFKKAMSTEIETKFGDMEFITSFNNDATYAKDTLLSAKVDNLRWYSQAVAEKKRPSPNPNYGPRIPAKTPVNNQMHLLMGFGMFFNTEFMSYLSRTSV